MDAEQVIRDFTSIVDEKPGSPHFARLGGAYLDLEDLRSALKILTEGVRSNPKYLTGQVLLAKALEKANYKKEARDRYGLVLRLDPENTCAMWKIAQLDFLEKRMEAGIEQLQRILAIDPTNEIAQRELEKRHQELFGKPESEIGEMELETLADNVSAESSEFEELFGGKEKIKATPNLTEDSIEELFEINIDEAAEGGISEEIIAGTGIATSTSLDEGDIFVEKTEPLQEEQQSMAPPVDKEEEIIDEEPMKTTEELDDLEELPSFTMQQDYGAEKPPDVSDRPAKEKISIKEETTSKEKELEQASIEGEQQDELEPRVVKTEEPEGESKEEILPTFSEPQRIAQDEDEPEESNNEEESARSEPLIYEGIVDNESAKLDEISDFEEVDGLESRAEFQPLDETLEIEGIETGTRFTPPATNNDSGEQSDTMFSDEFLSEPIPESKGGEVFKKEKDTKRELEPPVLDGIDDLPGPPVEVIEPEDAELETDDDSEMYTVTMAEIYADQGETKKAIAIYKVILSKTDDPERRERIEHRIEHLKTGSEEGIT